MLILFYYEFYVNWIKKLKMAQIFKQISISIILIVLFSCISKAQINKDYYKLNQVFDYMEDYYVDSLDMQTKIDDIINRKNNSQKFCVLWLHYINKAIAMQWLIITGGDQYTNFATF